MGAVVLGLAGACLWVLAFAVVVQRQRVLARRLARVERAAGARPPRPPGAGLRVVPTRRRSRKPSPTVTQLARLGTPLQRARG